MSSQSPAREANAQEPKSSLQPGTLFHQRYHVDRQLGLGGYGEVIAATDQISNQSVAIKILHSNVAQNDPQALARMRQEAHILKALDHPNIVKCIDIGTSAEGEFLVMELLHGKNISALLKEKGCGNSNLVLDVTRQLLDALHNAHAMQILHRDIKPDNILICDTSETILRPNVKLIDFGIAKAYEPQKLSDSDDGVTMVKTRLSGFVGTARYTAPEQAVGDPIGPESDLFSLGLVIYEWLTGTALIDATRHADIMMQLVHPTPFDLSNAPPQWQPWFERILQKNPSERFQTASAALQALNNLFDNSLPSVDDVADTITMDSPFAVENPQQFLKAQKHTVTDSAHEDISALLLTEILDDNLETTTEKMSVIKPKQSTSPYDSPLEVDYSKIPVRNHNKNNAPDTAVAHRRSNSTSTSHSSNSSNNKRMAHRVLLAIIIPIGVFLVFLLVINLFHSTP